MYTGIGAQSDALQDPPYLEHYGLVRDPFSLAIENDFFYEDPARSQNLDLLHHVTLSNELLMLVSGAHGSGKSSLLHRYIARASETWKICLINANSMLFEEQFMRQVFRGFGLTVPPEGGTNEYLKKLGEQLEDMQRQGEIALLIIDDAHELPTPTLQFLARLYSSTHDASKSLRIIMFAEQQIENILPSAGPLKQAITHTLELAPLSEKETAEYIKHRMMVAGFNSNSPSVFAYPFTDAVVSKIYKSSHGLPSQINKHAGQVLLDMSRGSVKKEKPASTQKSGRKFPAFTILAAILVAVTLVVMLAIQDTINELFTPSSLTTDKPGTPKNSTTTGTAKPGVIQRMQREPVMALPEEDSTQITESDITPGDTSEMVEHSTTVAPSESDMMARTAARRDAGTHTDQRNTLSSQSGDDISGTPPAAKDDSVITDTDPDKSAATQSETAKPAQATIPGPQDKTASASTVHTANEQPATSATTVAPEVVNKQMEWLYARNPWHYTLQLLSTHNLATIDKFITANQLEDKAVTLKSRRKDKDWYLLLYGDYPDATAASTTSAQLEKKKNFAGVKPWPRPFATLQTNLLGKKITPPGKTAAVAPSSRVTKPEPAKTVLKKPVPKPGSEDWLLAQNPWAYTIQLLGSKDRESISQYIKQHKLNSNEAISFHTWRDSSDWYILIYGIYASEKDARDAINKLPASLRTSSPWLRPVASVHSDIIRGTPQAR